MAAQQQKGVPKGGIAAQQQKGGTRPPAPAATVWPTRVAAAKPAVQKAAAGVAPRPAGVANMQKTAAVTGKGNNWQQTAAVAGKGNNLQQQQGKAGHADRS